MSPSDKSVSEKKLDIGMWFSPWGLMMQSTQTDKATGFRKQRHGVGNRPKDAIKSQPQGTC